MKFSLRPSSGVPRHRLPFGRREGALRLRRRARGTPLLTGEGSPSRFPRLFGWVSRGVAVWVKSAGNPSPVRRGFSVAVPGGISDGREAASRLRRGAPYACSRVNRSAKEMPMAERTKVKWITATTATIWMFSKLRPLPRYVFSAWTPEMEMMAKASFSLRL